MKSYYIALPLLLLTSNLFAGGPCKARCALLCGEDSACYDRCVSHCPIRRAKDLTKVLKDGFEFRVEPQETASTPGYCTDWNEMSCRPPH